MRSKADIEDIRDWLKTLNKDEYTDYTSNISHNELPESLQVLRAHEISFLSADENGNPKIRLRWGSGASGMWGIEIGMENMKIPASDFSQYGEYRLLVEPGVYVWHEIQ
jgi:hypothetical protein